MGHHQAHVAVGALNQTVGDWPGNERRIRAAIDEARAVGAKLLLLPEMCIPGYSLGDRLLRLGTVERSWARLMNLADATPGMAVAVGLPVLYEGVLYNAMGLLADGKLAGLACKENLAGGDVEYESRYFSPWPHGRVVDYRGPDGTLAPMGTQMFRMPGVGTFAFEICEDAWKGIRPGSLYALAGAELLLNPSASWFEIGKHRLRRRLVQQISREDHCAYLYGSLMGCDATRLIFDGSQFIAVNGRIEAEGRRFVFGREHEIIHQVVDLAEIRHARMEEGSWRDQIGRSEKGRPPIVEILGNYSTDEEAPTPPPYWIPPEPGHVDPSLAYLENSVLHRPITERDLSHLELELALSLALRDYVVKTRIPSLCLALSGGRDSAMVALIVQRMYRYENPEMSPEELKSHIAGRFVCAYLATENSGRATRDAARAVAREVGAQFLDGEIQAALSAATRTVEQIADTPLSWSDPAHDIPLQNIQARVRGMLIWTIANLRNSLLLVTSNKSEAAVGYTTMDGDTSGGLAPIADVPKSLVKLYLAWARRFHDLKGFELVDAMDASAELRPPGSAQTDEADLMPFPVLDQFMDGFVQKGLEPLAILKRYWPAVKSYYNDDLAACAADLKKFVRLMCFAQWKRERFAISFRVTSFDLDPKTGFRFPPVQAPFTEELAEVDAYVNEKIKGRNSAANGIDSPAGLG